MKSDVLCGIDELEVATEYELEGRRFEYFPPSAAPLSRVRPITRKVRGWKEPLDGMPAERWHEEFRRAESRPTKFGLPAPCGDPGGLVQTELPQGSVSH
jgi:hypothetical protein